MSADPISAPAGQPLRHLTRRSLIGASALATAMLAAPALVLAKAVPRVAALDYGLASTLIHLGIMPAAIVSLADWDKWVIEPAVPAGVADLGNGWEINFEVLAALKPELILTTAYLDAAAPRLERLGRVERFEVYTPAGGAILPKAYDATRRLGQAVDREAEAEAFLARADAFFEDCRKRLARVAPPPVVLAGFLDSRHVRIYAKPGLYATTLARIGVENAWPREGNYWGFDTIGIEQLAMVKDPAARIIAFEPMAADVKLKLAESPLWNALPLARPGNFSVLPGSLMFGLVADAMRFARIVTDHLEASA